MKNGAISLSLLLTTFLIPAYSATPPKAGSICSQQGLTKIYQGKKYTCIKSRKKLVWNNGVAIKTAAPAVAPTPAPTPTPTPKQSEDWADYQWIQKTLEISKLGRQSSDKLNFSNVFISQNFDKAIAEGLMEYTNIASAYWYASGVRISQPIEVAMFTEKDLDWFKRTIGITAPVVDNFFSHPEPSINFNGTVIIGSIPAKRFVIIYFVGTNYRDSKQYLSTTSSWKTALANMATHEFQHLVQFTRTLTTANGNLQAKLPCWFNEGMAAFYEDSLYLEELTANSSLKYLQEWLDTRGEASRVRKKRIQFLLSNTNSYVFDKRSVDGWHQFILSNYEQSSIGCSKTQYGYTLGRFLLEKFYIDHGSEKLLNILDDFQKSLNFDTSFKSMVGTSPQAWLREVGLPYFLEVSR